MPDQGLGDAEEGLGNPTEAPPRTSSFPDPVPPPPISAGRRGQIWSAGDNDKSGLSGQQLLFVELASFILTISAIAYGSANAWYALVWYALSVGLVSLLCCLSLRIAEGAKPGSLSAVVVYNSDPRLRNKISVLDLVSSVLFFWWGFGAFFLTFKGPFINTSNGYFAAWGGLCATIMWINLGYSEFGEDGSRMIQKLEGRNRALISLLASSVVVLLASIRYVRRPEGAWGLSCGAVSIVVAAILLAVDREKIVKTLRRVICVFLGLLWLAGASILTFYGPFKFTGNGYFGSWLGVLSSLWYAAHDWEN